LDGNHALLVEGESPRHLVEGCCGARARVEGQYPFLENSKAVSVGEGVVSQSQVGVCENANVSVSNSGCCSIALCVLDQVDVCHGGSCCRCARDEGAGAMDVDGANNRFVAIPPTLGVVLGDETELPCRGDLCGGVDGETERGVEELELGVGSCESPVVSIALCEAWTNSQKTWASISCCVSLLGGGVIASVLSSCKGDIASLDLLGLNDCNSSIIVPTLHLFLSLKQQLQKNNIFKYLQKMAKDMKKVFQEKSWDTTPTASITGRCGPGPRKFQGTNLKKGLDHFESHALSRASVWPDH